MAIFELPSIPFGISIRGLNLPTKFPRFLNGFQGRGLLLTLGGRFTGRRMVAHWASVSSFRLVFGNSQIGINPLKVGAGPGITNLPGSCLAEKLYGFGLLRIQLGYTGKLLTFCFKKFRILSPPRNTTLGVTGVKASL